jgi:ABC-2 type transport system ATP-binding protein
MTESVRAADLTRRFAARTAVDRLNLSVSPGEIYGLVGPDGAGKTTTMRMLAAVLDPTSGDAWICGRNTVREGEAVKEQIGYMSQRFGLYPDLTVMENIRFYADLYGVPARGRADKIDRLLEFSNLVPFRSRRAGRLSGGMKQKLALSCALVHTPAVLLLDEPTNGVDPVSRREFWRILYRLLREGVAIVVTTAYLDEAERCSRIGLIHRGQLVAGGTPQEVKRLMRGQLLEVRTDSARQAADCLRREWADAVGLFGDRVHVVTDDPAAAVPRIQRSLQAAGLTESGIRQVEPTLEDVFISVLAQNHEGSSRDGDRNQ